MAEEAPREGFQPLPPLSRAAEAEKVVQQLKEDKTLDALRREALEKLMNDVSWIPFS